MKLPRYPSIYPENPSVCATDMTSSILSALGISHTKETIVGNEYVRGVSGGERKRVSIAEVMATQVSRSFCNEQSALTVWSNIGQRSMLG
jgi:ATP-binding cassette, subfamily G (WHITE), member 2, SNQ2